MVAGVWVAELFQGLQEFAQLTGTDAVSVGASFLLLAFLLEIKCDSKHNGYEHVDSLCQYGLLAAKHVATVKYQYHILFFFFDSCNVHLDTIKVFIYQPMHNRIALKEY